LRSSSCLEDDNNLLSVNIIVKDKICTENDIDCKKADIFTEEDIYDFEAEV
jgi:hypothetical protein